MSIQALQSIGSDRPQVRLWSGMFQDIITGEALVPSSDGSGKLIHTDLYFAIPTQLTANVNDMQGPRILQYTEPWAFAAMVTAEQVREALEPFLPGVRLLLQLGEVNSQFPYSVRMLEIVAQRGNRTARVNAGLIASEIARSTAFVDGKIKQFSVLPLRNAAVELMNELEHEPEAAQITSGAKRIGSTS